MKSTPQTRSKKLRTPLPSFLRFPNLLHTIAFQGQLQMLIPFILGGIFVPAFTYNSLHTDLLNPWNTWCPRMETGDVHTGCFGTNWYKIGGPYSLMWYWTMIAFSFNGLIGFLWIPLIIGQLLAFLLFRKNKWLFYPFAIVNLIQVGAFTQNILIIEIVALALILPKAWPRIVRASPLLIAALYKLPIGAPATVWAFARSFSLSFAWNYVPYSMLAAFTIMCGTYVFLPKSRFFKITSLIAGLLPIALMFWIVLFHPNEIPYDGKSV